MGCACISLISDRNMYWWILTYEMLLSVAVAASVSISLLFCPSSAAMWALTEINTLVSGQSNFIEGLRHLPLAHLPVLPPPGSKHHRLGNQVPMGVYEGEEEPGN